MSKDTLKKIIRRESASPMRDDALFNGGVPIPVLLRRIFENRGITEPGLIVYPLNRLLSPDSLMSVDLAAGLLVEALSNQDRILIIGDYDTDGATATALALLCLKAMGAAHVDYLVPNRFDFGYGLSEGIAKVALDRKPHLVITVDNGINSIEGVSLLRRHGVSVIVTDHHLAGPVLPEANAIVNPNQPGCKFPSKAVAGVGVMFYLLLCLRSELRTSGWFEKNEISCPNLAEYLDLVALGTVADVVKLDDNNRILVANGIKRIRRGQCRKGILALLQIAGIHHHDMVSSDFGFVIAPRLNASGRLDDISTGIACLLAENSEDALGYAQTLNEINNERKRIESNMQAQAQSIISDLSAKNAGSAENNDRKKLGMCLYDESWHQGVTGLVASRIKDKTGQPSIVFANTKEGKLTGSARSIPGLHIKDLLDSIAINNPNLIDKFGGHAMAAGLTIDKNNFSDFTNKFQSRVRAHFDSTQWVNAIETDGELQLDEISLANAKMLKKAAPWGEGFPAPKFDGVFHVLDSKIVGDIHLKMTLQPVEKDRTYQAIAFRAIEPGQLSPDLYLIRAVYQLDVNHFRGETTLQLIVEYFEKYEHEKVII